jgi:hypothetical protein
VKANLSMKNLFLKIFHYFCIGQNEKLPHDKNHHITYLAIIGTILILPFFFTFQSNNKSNISFLNLNLPPLCLSKSMFDAECPGCGMTRSFVKIASFKLIDAFNFNRVSIPLFIYFIYAFMYHAYCLRILDKEIPKKLAYSNRILANVILALLIVNWFLGLFIGSNGGLS